MKVLVVGSGGREHAVCAAFTRSHRVSDVYCAPGNAGIAEIARCVPIGAEDIGRLADFAVAEQIDLTFVGGETPLALGIVDLFINRGLRVVGPTREAAQLESSKAFAKDFMARYEVPTARFAVAHSAAFAALMLESGDFGGPDSPVVVKADGLAAGKGVVVARNRAEAVAACGELEAAVGSAAVEKIVLEECLIGDEISLLMFADGEDFALMPPTRDHKRMGDGDTGPNTGGMGTITDDSLLPTDQIDEILRTIVRPTLHGCIRDGFPFRGIMFLGLMMTKNGPRVLEYNVRFGDPEAQAILIRLETDLVEVCEAMPSNRGLASTGGEVVNSPTVREDADVHAGALPYGQVTDTLGSLDIRWKPGSSACVVLAVEGYPSKPRDGDVISGLEAAAERENVSVFHAGTSKNLRGQFVTAGGRVLGVTATGADLNTALSRAYEAVADIAWPGMQYRKDIGKTGQNRER